MAEPAAKDAAQYIAGEMPIEEHRATYRFFDSLVRFGSLAIACLVLFLTLWFCAHAGFFTALIVAGVLAALGGWFLRMEPASVDTL